MRVVLPQPVGPTMATLLPAGTETFRSSMSGFSGSYEKRACSMRISPRTLPMRALPERSSPGSSVTSNTRAAEAKAFCSWVTTLETSLKGLVYWLA